MGQFTKLKKKKKAKKANSTGTDVGDDKNTRQSLWVIIIWTHQLCLLRARRANLIGFDGVKSFFYWLPRI